MTDAQRILELERGKSILQVMHEALETHRGETNLTGQAAASLGVTEQTFRSWCSNGNIDLRYYRSREVPDDVAERP